MQLPRRFSWAHVALGAIAVAIVLLFPLRYSMPFRLDDVLLMEWSNAHSLLDAFKPDQGQIVNSVRPIFASTAWLLTHTAGAAHPVIWHVVLVVLLVIALVFTGRLAKFYTGSDAALVLAPVLYFLAFTGILNVFFWFSDMTYGLELAFTTIAWYYGVRGMLEGSLAKWCVGSVAAVLAVLSKEPAVVMIHAVFAGTLVLRLRDVRAAWQSNRRNAAVAVLLYAVLVAATLYVILISPTRINRFFSFADLNLSTYIADRLGYYSSIYVSPIARVLLFFPVIFVAARRLIGARLPSQSPMLVVLAFSVLVVCGVALTSVTVALPLLVVALMTYVLPKRSDTANDSRAVLLLPYLLTIVIAFATLLVTIQLVKTQLTEIAFMSVVIAAWGWIASARILGPIAKRYRRQILLGLAIPAIAIVVLVMPKFARQERLLRQAAAVRWNANNAVTWSAAHLPKNSSLLVTTYMAHGYAQAGVLTSADDETKLREQATFDGGYVYNYLEKLGRRDIDKGYLVDSSSIGRVLNAYRAEPKSYLLVQTDLDRALLAPLLTSRDTMVAQFARPPYSSSVWLLRR